MLRCVSIFDSILWTRCLLQRLNVPSGFSIFKVILAFIGFDFLRLLFICFFRYNVLRQFLFPCSSFQKKLRGDMRARYDISSILLRRSFFFLFFFVRSIAWTQLHACCCFFPKTSYLKAKGAWWKKVWPKKPLCSWGCQLRYLTTVMLYKIFPLFPFTNMYILRFFLHIKDILSVVLDSFLWFSWQLYLSDNQFFCKKLD